MTRRIYINGRFLTGAVTGVQRYAREIVTALDRQLAASPDLRENFEFVLLVPGRCDDTLPLMHIRQKKAGAFSGHGWEQFYLPWLARDGYLLNLANSAPLFKLRQLLIIHDAVIYRFPQYFSKAYRSLHMLIDGVCSRIARIGTVSDFSAREIAQVLKVPERAIPVFANGHDHILRIDADSSIIEKLGLADALYFFILGSKAPHKNIDFAIEAFLKSAPKNFKLVVSGGANSKVFADSKLIEASNIIYTGRVSDEAIVALYRRAYALLFPSLYEGFGIPPIEALACGAPVLVSDIDVLKEVCGAAAIYFSPTNPEGLERAIRDVTTDRSILVSAFEHSRSTLQQFTWEKSAEKLLKYLQTV
ncbi:glycosyltransferase family 4 protein [Agrobacterium sp. NPDC090273]|uniref:glycosyltransferase family 4 protein n=1 Tax=Agrobacterium sp. NPDC090273 TaxID=3363919 RepID=UPI00383A3C37